MRAGDIAITGWAFSVSFGRLASAFGSLSFFCGAATRSADSRKQIVATAAALTGAALAQVRRLRRWHMALDLEWQELQVIVPAASGASKREPRIIIGCLQPNLPRSSRP